MKKQEMTKKTSLFQGHTRAQAELRVSEQEEVEDDSMDWLALSDDEESKMSTAENSPNLEPTPFMTAVEEERAEGGEEDSGSQHFQRGFVSIIRKVPLIKPDVSFIPS